MGLIDHFLKSKQTVPTKTPAEIQAVLIYFDGEDLEGSMPLQDNLYALLNGSVVGEFDGNEVGGNQLVLFLYGADAEILFQHIEPTLKADEFCKGARVVIRQGGPNAPQRVITF